MNSTAKSFTIVTGFSVVTRLLSFMFKIWMSRGLGAETVGLYQISLSVLLLLFTITAGAPTVLSRKVAEAASKGDIKRQNALTTASVVLGLSISATLCAVFYIFSNRLGFIFADERCMDIFLIMLPALVTSTLYSSIRSWFWGRKNFLAFSSTELIDEIFKIVLAILFAGGLIGSLTGAKGVALAFTLSDLLCVLILAILFFKSGGRLAKPQGYKEIIFSTVPLSATRIITNLTASLTALIIPQRLVAGGLTVAAATAEYGRVAGMAFPLIMAPITIVGALSVVLTPDIAQLHAQGRYDEISKKLSSTITFAMLVASVFFVIYLPLGREIGYLFFGDKVAGTFVSYCSLLLFPVALAQATTPVLNSLGCEKHTLINSVCGAITVLPCIFLLPKYIGVYSMAIGSACSFIVIAAMNLIVLRKRLGKFGTLKKSAQCFFFAIPLAVLGLLSARLLSPYAGETLSVVVIGIYLLFFIFIFITAFDVVDIAGYVALFKPRVRIMKRKRTAHTRKIKKAKL